MNKLLVLLSFFCILGCNKQVSKEKMQNQEWINPRLECNIPDIATKISEVGGDSEKTGKEGLASFCDRMNNRFAKSGLSTSDAAKVYQRISNSGLNLDESFGQPDPAVDIPETSKTKLTERVAILKVSDSSYEIYYIKTGCGKTYFHGKFTIHDNSQNLNIEPIEVWQAAFPC